MVLYGVNPSQRIVSSMAVKYSYFSASGFVSSNLWMLDQPESGFEIKDAPGART